MKLVLFDGAALIGNDGLPVRIPTRPTFILLVLLAISAGQRHHRQTLASTVWPNSSPRDSLRTALSALRKALPPDSIVTIENDVMLKPGIVECPDLDCQDLPGEFLPGIDHDWVVEMRIDLRTRRVRGLCHRAKQQLAKGELEEALSAAEQACLVDPLSDGAATLRVEILERMGDVTEATIIAQAHRRRAFHCLGVLSDVRPKESAAIEHPLLTAAEWVLDRNPDEALALLAATESQWQGMAIGPSLSIHERVLAATTGDTGVRRLVEAHRLMLLWVTGKLSPHLPELEIAVKGARERNETDTAFQLGAALAYGYLSNGEFTKSLNEARLVLDYANATPHSRIQTRANILMGIILQHTGHAEASYDLVERNALGLVPDSSVEQIELQIGLATIRRREGKIEQAAEILEGARRIYEASSATRRLGWVTLEEAFLFEAVGEFDRADERLQSIERLGPEVTGHSLVAIVGEARARIAGERGEFMRAAEALFEVQAFRSSLGTVPSISERKDLLGTRRLLKERLSPNDIRVAYERARASVT